MDYEEISLKELILILLKGWKWIVSITFITTLAAIFFTLIIKPVLYESNSSFNIKIPSNVETQFGTFYFPSTNVADYTVYLTSDDILNKVIDDLQLDVSSSKLKEYLSFTYDIANGVNLVNTSVKYSDPSLSVEIHNVWLDSFVESLSNVYQDIAIDQLTANIETKLTSLYVEQESIRTQVALLNNYKDTLTYHNGVSVDDSADNYQYYQVINKLMGYELRDYEISNSVILYQQDLKDLEAISVLSQRSDELNVLNGTITLPKLINEPTEPLDRGLLLNTAIGFVLGAMLGVFIVFFMNYWKSEVIK